MTSKDAEFSDEEEDSFKSLANKRSGKDGHPIVREMSFSGHSFQNSSEHSR